jgi:hypothetical protein
MARVLYVHHADVAACDRNVVETCSTEVRAGAHAPGRHACLLYPLPDAPEGDHEYWESDV